MFWWWCFFFSILLYQNGHVLVSFWLFLTSRNWHGACLLRDNGFLPEVFTRGDPAARFEQHIAFSLHNTSVLSLGLGKIIKKIAYFCPGSFEESVVI